MPGLTAADTIKILVATDSHVGYEERDPIRKDDSWKSFHEVMCLAKSEDVDMVLLAGDLFHDNKPSRKAMYQVMRSLRMNCLGEKPCELEMLSDASDVFEGAFNHVNYEDPDINIAIPVFSIHGNHDDPSGDGHFCSLDLLQVSGLLNYFGRTPESDNIHVKPVLLQKGQTKLALYGMSNVRDERLFRTFRDGKVKFFKPSIQQTDWFNLMAVHQNHYAHTETSYLPENFLPEFMDLIVWGHEHECLIDPRYNPETTFHVMQPGSSVATSLVPGESVPKHVAIVNVTGKEFKVERHRIRSVRPFIMKEIILAEDKKFKGLEKKKDNKQELTRKLMDIVEGLIKEAQTEWLEAQSGDEEVEEVPLPLVRLRVEYSAPDGGKFDCENPQRFSNRFVGKVANVNDVVQFYRKKIGSRKSKDPGDMPEESVLASLAIDNVKVERLVREFLAAQSLKILPQAPFGDAVSQFVDKDDKHAMEIFVNQSLARQVKQMLDLHDGGGDDGDNGEPDLEAAMERYRKKLEQMFEAGTLRRARSARFKPRPANWNSDFDGEWEEQPAALQISDGDENGAPAPAAPPATTTTATAASSRRGVRVFMSDEEDFATPAPAAPAKATMTASKRAAPAKKAPARKPAASKTATKKKTPSKTETARGGRKAAAAAASDDDDDDDADDNDDDEDIIMLDDDDEPAAARTRAQPKRSAPARAAPSRAAPSQQRVRQTQLNFTQQSKELSDDEISDDDDAFEPMKTTRRR